MRIWHSVLNRPWTTEDGLKMTGNVAFGQMKACPTYFGRMESYRGNRKKPSGDVLKLRNATLQGGGGGLKLPLRTVTRGGGGGGLR